MTSRRLLLALVALAAIACAQPASPPGHGSPDASAPETAAPLSPSLTFAPEALVPASVAPSAATDTPKARGLPWHATAVAAPDPRPQADIDAAACTGHDGAWHCATPKPGPKLFGAFGAGTRPAIIPDSWTIPHWYIDPSNASTHAADSNTCASSGAPCLTYAEVAARWGTYDPRLRQSTTLTFLSASTGTADPIIFRPFDEAGASVTVEGSPATVATGVLGTITAKNRATPQLLKAVLPAGSYAVGELVLNATHPSYAFLYSNVTGTTWNLTQPLNVSTGAEVDTWTAGDTVTTYSLPALDLVEVKPHPTTSGVTILNCGTSNTALPAQSVTRINDFVLMQNVYAQRVTTIEPVGEGPGPYLVNAFAKGLDLGSHMPPYAGTPVVIGGAIVPPAGTSKFNALGGGVLDQDVIVSAPSGPWTIDRADLGLVYLDTSTTLTAGAYLNVTGSDGGILASAAPIVWGPGTINAVGAGMVAYAAANTAVGTFLNSGFVTLNGLAVACNGSASQIPLSCDVPLTAAALDATLGATGFQGNAWTPGGSSISDGVAMTPISGGGGGGGSSPGAYMSGLEWLLPCLATPIGAGCTGSGSPVVVTTTLSGDPSVTYSVPLRFRGVIEQKTYTGGSNDGAYWQVGGTPFADGWNNYSLTISSPASTYYLNRGASGIPTVFAVDYTKTIPIQGGATVTLTADPVDAHIIANNAAAGGPLSVALISSPTQPYNGQFLRVDYVPGGSGGAPGCYDPVTGALLVACGGTDDVTLTSHGVLLGQGTGSVTAVAPSSTVGIALLSSGASADPAYGRIDLSSNNIVTNVLAPINGGSGVSSPTAHDLLIGNGTGAMSQLAPSATSGVPVISQGASADPVYGRIDVSSNSVITNVMVPLNGGTGVSNPAAHKVCITEGSSAFTCLAPSSTTGIPLVSQGTSADPAYSTTAIAGGGTGATTATAGFDALSPLTTQGDVLYFDGTHNVRLGYGTSGYVLSTNGAGANPSWISAPGGGSPGGAAGGGLGGTYPNPTVLSVASVNTGVLASTYGGTGVSAPTAHDVCIAEGASAFTCISPGATSGIALVSNGTSADPSFTTVVPAGGGTGLATLTAHNVMFGEGTSNVAFAAPGATTGVPLVSNGSSSDPSFTTASIAGGGTGQTTRTAAFDGLAPASPAQGDLLYNSGTHWVDLAAGSANQFLMTGGASANPSWSGLGALMTGANVNTDETQAASAAYGNLATSGPAVTVGTSTSVIVTMSAYAYDTQATGGTHAAFVSVAVSGATTLAAADSNGTAMTSAGASFTTPLSRSLIITGLTGGTNTFTVKYRNDGGTVWHFANRSIVVQVLAIDLSHAAADLVLRAARWLVPANDTLAEAM